MFYSRGMNEQPDSEQSCCTAITAAGNPCTYTAVPGSSPPRCELHGLNFVKEIDLLRETSYYDRFLAKRENTAELAQLDLPSLLGELRVTRMMNGRLLELIGEAEADEATVKALTPLIFRGVKLVSDLMKQLGGVGGDNQWDEVLDRLGEELDIEL